jgi:membrane protease YdiL (CAAX protease family)
VIGFWPIVVTYLLVRAFWIWLDQGIRLFQSLIGSASLKVAVWVVPCVAIAMAVNRAGVRRTLREFGFGHGLRKGMTFALLTTAPFAVAVAITGVNVPGVAEFLAVVIVDPIAESILFSGFLFSQLRRWVWRPLPALIASGLLFGLAHLDGQELTLVGYVYRMVMGLDAYSFWIQLGWFALAVAAAGAAGFLFTWLFHRWGTLWPTIAFHAAINFWWTLSADRDMTDRTVTSWVTVTGVAHGLAMAIAVIATLRLTRRPTT